jgi:hypothetical protein
MFYLNQEYEIANAEYLRNLNLHYKTKSSKTDLKPHSDMPKDREISINAVTENG